MPHVTVDLTYALERTLGPGRGLRLADCVAEAARLGEPAAWLDGERAAGRAAWFDLPLDVAPADAVAAWAAGAPASSDVVLVGIGGSALTARIVDAVRPAGESAPCLHVLDTVDPRPVQDLMQRLDPASTCVIGVSKSGGTLETGAVFLVLEAWLRDALGDEAARRLVVIAGEQSNPLRTRAEARGYTDFAVPTAVGGRYSGLTPVGLLPAACVGLDPHALLRGAAVMRERCLESDVHDNPALALAAVHAAAERAGRSVAILWPYGEALRPLGPWWAQLVGESLGKPGPEGPVGVTPLAATGPADQHSLLQALIEGPDDKLVVFVEAESLGPDTQVPAGEDDVCLATGQTLGAVLAAEREATEYALAAAGRPSITVRLAAADAASVGAFLFASEAAVVFWGSLIGVDPFGQPGVELGKRAAAAALTGAPEELAAALERHRGVERIVSS